MSIILHGILYKHYITQNIHTYIYIYITVYTDYVHIIFATYCGIENTVQYVQIHTGRVYSVYIYIFTVYIIFIMHMLYLEHRYNMQHVYIHMYLNIYICIYIYVCHVCIYTHNFCNM